MKCELVNFTFHCITLRYIFYRFVFEVLKLSVLSHILMTCITEVALIFVDNPDPEGQGFCQAGFSVDFTKVTNLPPQPCLCISSIWLHTPVRHILLFVQNLTAVVSSFKWKWFYLSLCPFIQAGWGLIPYYFFYLYLYSCL